MQTLYLMVWALPARIRGVVDDSNGFTTAELVANAALAIVALIAIWTALRLLGVHVVSDISTKLSQF